MGTGDAKRKDETSTQAAAWHEVVRASLKANDVKLIAYVPDRVFTPLIEALHADPYFTAFAATREEEALGIITGAWMGGMRGAVLMQTSGFGTIPNALASLAVPSQIPADSSSFPSAARWANSISDRRWCAGPCGRCSIRSPMEHVTITRPDELEFMLDRSIKQAVATQAPVALILSPLLTGGKVFEK